MKLPIEKILQVLPDRSTQPIKQGQGRQQRNSTPRQTKTDSTNRSSNNSFGPDVLINDRRSN
jgi:ATP-dependent RNA helicase RhlE